jgi:hypothetical protein
MKMGKMSRNKLEVTKRRREVASLYLQGWPQADIAEKLQMSQSTVCLDLRRIHNTWKESGLMDFHTRQVVELQKLDRLEREAWAAWERSQKPSQQARVKGGRSEQDAERVVKNQIGDPRFLDQVHKCIASRRALLGLDGPVKIEARSPMVLEPVLSIEERRQRLIGILERASKEAAKREAAEQHQKGEELPSKLLGDAAVRFRENSDAFKGK